MTPDDVGGLQGEPQRPRARQNVIFELGFFIGMLGPERVAALVSSEVERPSDFDGVVYIPIDTDWRLPLCRELRAAGYSIDLNKVL
jgi:predicted nucleotide-binding protein